MSYVKTITVNELDSILEKHFRAKNILITEIEAASIENQHDPKKINVGVGGVLTITFDSSRKLK